MTDPATFRTLAQRAREASGPDRQLDADVARALGWHDPEGAMFPMPSYSESLDRVIRDVVPEGWDGEFHLFRDGLSEASLYPAGEDHMFPSAAFDGRGETLALGALAAALDARAALAEPGPDQA